MAAKFDFDFNWHMKRMNKRTFQSKFDKTEKEISLFLNYLENSLKLNTEIEKLDDLTKFQCIKGDQAGSDAPKGVIIFLSLYPVKSIE